MKSVLSAELRARDDAREAIVVKTQQFLNSGKQIELVPIGKSAYDDKELKVSRMIITGS